MDGYEAGLMVNTLKNVLLKAEMCLAFLQILQMRIFCPSLRGKGLGCSFTTES